MVSKLFTLMKFLGFQLMLELLVKNYLSFNPSIFKHWIELLKCIWQHRSHRIICGCSNGTGNGMLGCVSYFIQEFPTRVHITGIFNFADMIFPSAIYMRMVSSLCMPKNFFLRISSNFFCISLHFVLNLFFLSLSIPWFQLWMSYQATHNVFPADRKYILTINSKNSENLKWEHATATNNQS